MQKTNFLLGLLVISFVATMGLPLSHLTQASIAVSSFSMIQSPNNTTYSPGPIILNLTGWGLGGLNIYYTFIYSLDGGNNVTLPCHIQGHDMSFQVTITSTSILPAMSEGSHKLTVYLKNEWDTSQPWTSWSISTVYFTVDDGKPPAISILAPNESNYCGSEVPLNFTVNKPVSWFGYSLDGQDNVTVAGNATLTNLTYGSHDITVYARDLAGKTANQTVDFRVTEPQVHARTTTSNDKTLIAAAIPGICILAIDLILYRRNQKTANLKQ